MALINLYKGGRPYIHFPDCDSRREYHLPYPQAVSDVHSGGLYTLTNSLHPLWRPDQGALLKGLTGLQQINMIVVPPEHLITGAWFKIEPEAVGENRIGYGGACNLASMAGVVFDIVLRIYNLVDDVWATPAPAPLATITLFTGIPADVYDSNYSNLVAAAVPNVVQPANSLYIEKDQVAFVEFAFTTPPASPFTYDELSGRMTATLKVHRFAVQEMA